MMLPLIPKVGQRLCVKVMASDDELATGGVSMDILMEIGAREMLHRIAGSMSTVTRNDRDRCAVVTIDAVVMTTQDLEDVQMAAYRAGLHEARK